MFTSQYALWSTCGAALLLGLCLLMPAPAEAQRVWAFTGSDSVAVGEPFTLTVVAEYTMVMEATFPALDAAADARAGDVTHQFGDLEVLRVRNHSGGYFGTDRPGMRADTVVYEVTTFALDTARVAPVPVTFSSAGATATQASSSFFVPVRSVVQEETAGLRGLAPLAEFPRGWGLYVLLALLAVGVLGAAWYAWRRRPDEAPEPAPSVRAVPPVPPAVRTRRRLRRLEHTTDWSDPAYAKPFFTALVAILRLYLSRRLDLPAAERTTTELVQACWAVDPPLPSTAVEALQSVLQVADLAKFADAVPGPAAGQEALQEAHAFIDAVEDTLPSPPSPPAPSEGSAPPARSASRSYSP
jgi:hypothetical protein